MKLIKLDPKNSMAFTGLGKCYSRKKDYKTAIAVEKEAVRLFPDNHWAYLVISEAYEGLNMQTDARDALRRAIQLRPQDPACKAALAKLLNQKIASSPNAMPR
jgi:cytochrome c-type biogenesis protein CcmH/NrfG